VRQPKANATSSACVRAAGRASAIHEALRRAAPAIGHDGLQQRHGERERQRELTELRDHGVCSVFCVRSTAARSMHAWLRGACSSRRASRALRAR